MEPAFYVPDGVQDFPRPPAAKTIATFDLPAGATVSDGFHTFEELYDHRVELFIALLRALPMPRPILPRAEIEAFRNRIPWRAELHSDGSRFAGWFVLGVGEDKGTQITYHLPMWRWDQCDFAVTRARGPEFDGHTPADVLVRLAAF